MQTTWPVMAMEAERPCADNKTLVRRCVEEACNRGNLDMLDAVLAPSYRTPRLGPAAPGGPAAVKLFLRLIRDALPDARWVVEEQIADGDTAVTRLCVHGTHRGPLCGIAPTGKQVTVRAILASYFADGRIVEQWAQIDLLDLLDQLGVLPDMELEKVVAVACLLRAGAALAGDQDSNSRGAEDQ